MMMLAEEAEESFRVNRGSQSFADVLQNDVLKNFTNFTGKHLCWSLFLIKLQLHATEVTCYWFSGQSIEDEQQSFIRMMKMMDGSSFLPCPICIIRSSATYDISKSVHI